MPTLSKGDRVRIVRGSHPHSGCEGRWTGKVIAPAGDDMIEVGFDRRHLGKRGCFVKPGNVHVIEKSGSS